MADPPPPALSGMEDTPRPLADDDTEQPRSATPSLVAQIRSRCGPVDGEPFGAKGEIAPLPEWEDVQEDASHPRDPPHSLAFRCT